MRERALLVGGDVEVESRPSVGTRVSLRVPLRPADTETTPWSKPQTESQPMKVLIADDHGIVRSGLRMLLERQTDIEVIGEAADGARPATWRSGSDPTWRSSTSRCPS